VIAGANSVVDLERQLAGPVHRALVRELAASPARSSRSRIFWNTTGTPPR
jgi:hypothetical protein